MIAIFKREFRSYIFTPSAYVFFTITFFFFGVFFALNHLFTRVGYSGPVYPTANFSNVMGTMSFILILIIPSLTMRLIAEERRQKTDQLLFTSPISIPQIVFGKYLSALAIFAICMIISMIYPLMVYLITKAAVKYLVAVYLGYFLLGSALLAIGMFASALVESQAVAWFLGFFFNLILWIVQMVANGFTSETVKNVLNWFSIYQRLVDFMPGTIKISAVVYMLSIVIIFIFLTIRTIEKRRWTEG